MAPPKNKYPVKTRLKQHSAFSKKLRADRKKYPVKMKKVNYGR